jgi:hypothetical protein
VAHDDPADHDPADHDAADYHPADLDAADYLRHHPQQPGRHPVTHRFAASRRRRKDARITVGSPRPVGTALQGNVTQGQAPGKTIEDSPR